MDLKAFLQWCENAAKFLGPSLPEQLTELGEALRRQVCKRPVAFLFFIS